MLTASCGISGMTPARLERAATQAVLSGVATAYYRCLAQTSRGPASLPGASHGRAQTSRAARASTSRACSLLLVLALSGGYCGGPLESAAHLPGGSAALYSPRGLTGPAAPLCSFES